MKKLCSTVFLSMILGLYSCTTKPEEAIAENNIREYLSRQASEISGNFLTDTHDLKEWEQTKDKKHGEFLEMMGVDSYFHSPSRSPLQETITGEIQQKGYKIVKLHYQSLPELFVPANLYLPDDITSPRPAILYVCGHAHTQKTHYQAHPRKLAELGFVVLVIETIQFGEVWGHHWGPYSKGWFNWYSRGYNPAGVELWNAIRGLDLLADRPDVDEENMGVTGISGGGSQSWYIAAADPRIKAAAPVCGASTLKAQIGTRTLDGHCDCMMPINTYQIDFADIGALIAPRPLLIGQSDRDGLNTIESVHELHGQLQKPYEWYGRKQNLGMVETPGGHSYHALSRTRIFSFFMQHLMGKEISPEEVGDIENSNEDFLTNEELLVFGDEIPKGDRTTVIQDDFLPPTPVPELMDMTQISAYRDSVKSFLMEKTFGAFPKNTDPLDQKLEFRTLDDARYGKEIYSFVSEKGWRLKVEFLYRNPPDEKSPLLLILRNPGEERWESESYAAKIVREENIAFVELRGVGEFGWAPELSWHVRRAAAWTGRTIASMQVYDLLRTLELCRQNPAIDPENIHVAAREDMAVITLYGALLDGNVKTLVLQDPPPTQDIGSDPNGKGAVIEMLNVLKITDTYQIPLLIAPTEVIFMDSIPEAYQWSDRMLKNAGMKPLITKPVSL